LEILVGELLVFEEELILVLIVLLMGKLLVELTPVLAFPINNTTILSKIGA
jgi:hypothetical protein